MVTASSLLLPVSTLDSPLLLFFTFSALNFTPSNSAFIPPRRLGSPPGWSAALPPPPQLLKPPQKVSLSAGSSVWDEADLRPPATPPPHPLLDPKALDVFQPQARRHTHIMDMCGPHKRPRFIVVIFDQFITSLLLRRWRGGLHRLRSNGQVQKMQPQPKKKSLPMINPSDVHRLINTTVIGHCQLILFNNYSSCSWEKKHSRCTHVAHTLMTTFPEIVNIFYLTISGK